MQGLPKGVHLPPAIPEALTLGHLLDSMWAQRPSKQMEASPWYQRAIHLVRSELARLTSAAAKVQVHKYNVALAAQGMSDQSAGIRGSDSLQWLLCWS